MTDVNTLNERTKNERHLQYLLEEVQRVRRLAEDVVKECNKLEDKIKNTKP